MLARICRAFAGIKDYRRGDVKHPIFSFLTILLLAKVAGCYGWDAAATWAEAQVDLLRQHLPLWRKAPGADTFRRAAEAYGLQDFLDAITIEGDAVHIDGKRARAANHGGQVHHFIEALCAGQVIGLVETGAGAEGPAIETLVRSLDLAGKLVTIDAAATTPAVTAAVRERKGDYLIAVAGNAADPAGADGKGVRRDAGTRASDQGPRPRTPRDAQRSNDHHPEDRRPGDRHGQDPGYPLPVPH